MLELKDININLGDFSLRNFSISVKKGDYYVILGESGAGKSILLELLSGLIKPDSGMILFNNENITKQSIQKREIGLVFQDYAIFPHMNVFDNIAFPIRKKGFSKQIIKNKIDKIAEQTDVTHLLKRKTTELSGGELQRVAMARTLILKPKLLLLDEPLVSLDVKLKDNLRSLLRNLNKAGQTIIHITHDYEEAISLASKIAVIKSGELIQEGKSIEIFNHPKSEFVANFTGVKNFFKAKYISDNKVFVKKTITIQAQPCEQEDEGYIMIPGETIIISEYKQKSSAVNNFPGQIISIIPSRFGNEINVDIGIDLVVHITNESVKNLKLNEGKEVWISFKANSVRFISKS